MFKKIDPNFPVHSFKNFFSMTDDQRDKAVMTCLRYHHKHIKRLSKLSVGYNYAVPKAGVLEEIPKKVNEALDAAFGGKLTNDSIYAYSSNSKTSFDLWHDHAHVHTTVTTVYYLQLPNHNESGIQFEMGDNILDYKPEQDELVIFPGWLNHRPYKSGVSEEWRVSLNMDRIYDTPDRIFTRMGKEL